LKTTVAPHLKQVSTRVPEEVRMALKTQAAKEGRSVSVIIAGIIGEYLSKTTKLRPLNSTETLLRHIQGLPRKDNHD